MDQTVILSAVCTPIREFQGGLAPLSAPQLGAKAVAEAVRRASIDPKSVDEVIMALSSRQASGKIQRDSQAWAADSTCALRP
jgi:acetyl-CoA C-acetyltransferase